MKPTVAKKLEIAMQMLGHAAELAPSEAGQDSFFITVLANLIEAIELQQEQITTLEEDKRQLIVGFQAVNEKMRINGLFN